MIKFNSKNHEIEYPPSPMDQFDLNLTSFKLSYAGLLGSAGIIIMEGIFLVFPESNS